MRFGLTANGTVYAMGIAPAAGRPRITAKELLQSAEAYGLHGGEIPLDVLKHSDADEAADYARERGLFINVGAGGFEPAALKEALQLADRIGALTVRTVVGGARFGGDRRHNRFYIRSRKSWNRLTRPARIWLLRTTRTSRPRSCSGCAKRSVRRSLGSRWTQAIHWLQLKSRLTFSGE
jgi:hypothetical protein